VRGDGTATPDVTRPQGLRLALWVYGLPQAWHPQGWRALRDAAAQVEDVMDWPDDRFGLARQLRPLAEIAKIAWRERVSLQAASTRDIEWDGPDQRAI